MESVDKNSSQDPKVLSVFEIVSAYFCDTVFNHVHYSAKMGLSSGASLTDEYVRQIHAYVLGVKTDSRCYSDVIRGVHGYFTGTTRFTTISFAEFVDRIVGVCVPEEYFRQFNAQDKDELLSSVICDLVANLAAFATTPDMLRRIIDGHTSAPEVTIRMLQDAAVGALVTKRAALHNKFLRKIGQARDTVPIDVVEDMKKALRRLVKEKAEAVAQAQEAGRRADQACESLDALKAQLRDGKLREAKLVKLVDLLRRGRSEGAAAVGASLSVPRRETLAEVQEPAAGPPRRPPRRERIAERHEGSLASEGSSEGSVRGSLVDAVVDAPRAPRRARGSAPGEKETGPAARRAAEPTVSASFFKVASGGLASGGLGDLASGGLGDLASGVTAQQLRTMAPPARSAMMARLMNSDAIEIDSDDESEGGPAGA
jgi:hypothetical protein